MVDCRAMDIGKNALNDMLGSSRDVVWVSARIMHTVCCCEAEAGITYISSQPSQDTDQPKFLLYPDLVAEKSSPGGCHTDAT